MKIVGCIRAAMQHPWVIFRAKTDTGKTDRDRCQSMMSAMAIPRFYEFNDNSKPLKSFDFRGFGGKLVTRLELATG
jgi:hypothetical protein